MRGHSLRLRADFPARPRAHLSHHGDLPSPPPPQARSESALVFCDTWDNAASFAASHPLVFLSHQWLGRTEPDPTNAHFSAVCDALDQLCDAEGLAHDDLYLWLDYS